MDIPHLRQFVVLAHELHFGRAAEKLGTAQPTLSQQIVALERDLGVRLFERTRRKVLLTDAGAVLLREAEALFAALAMATDRVGEAAKGRRGVLNLGCSSPAIGSFLPRLMRAFRREYPAVEVTIDVMHSRPLFESLQDRRLHAAFARDGMHAEAISSRRLWEAPYRVILAEDHPLAARETIALRELAGTALISMSRRMLDGSFDRLLTLCRAEGFEPREIKEVDRFDSVIGLVACNIGVAILPDAFETRGNGVVTRTIAFGERATPAATLWTSVYWNAGETSLLLHAFLERTFAECEEFTKTS